MGNIGHPIHLPVAVAVLVTVNVNLCAKGSNLVIDSGIPRHPAKIETAVWIPGSGLTLGRTGVGKDEISTGQKVAETDDRVFIGSCQSGSVQA